MRVAVWHNLPSGGGKRALHDHLRHLVEQGHHVEVWCPPTADRAYLPLDGVAAEHVVALADPADGPRVALGELLGDRSAAVAAMDAHVAACAAEIDGGDFDVLFANSCRSFRSTGIGRVSRLPSVLYLQEPYRWLYEAMPEPPFAAAVRGPGWWRRPAGLRAAAEDAVVTRRKRLRVRAEVDNTRAYDAVLCNSQYSRESILRAFGVDASVCYLGVDADHFSPDPATEREGTLLTVGAAVPEKNVAFLVRAVAATSQPRPPLVWVANTADDNHVAEVGRLARSLGVDLRVRTDIGDAELLGLYRSASLLLYAPRLEPFGLVPLEAAGCGLATVAVAEAGTRETIVDGVTGRLVDPSPDAMGAAVAELLADPAAAATMGRAARRRLLKDWTLDAAGRRLEAALAEVAYGRPIS